VSVFALVFLSLVAFVPQTFRPPLAGRVVVVFVAIAIGVPLVALLAARGDRGARWAIVFLAWAVVSAALSHAPVAWTGTFFSLTGFILVAGMVAFYGIGRALPEDAIGALTTAVLAGAAVNAGIAIIQAFTSLDAFDLPLYDNRTTGLLGNPVFLGALCAAAVALLPPLLNRRRLLGTGVAFLLAAGTQLSGTRNALAVLVAVVLWAMFRTRGLRAALLGVAVAAGIAFGATVHPPGTQTALARLETPSGLSNRVENWREAGVALTHRPIVGYGPGRFRAAATPYRTPELARIGPDRLYEDAHNVVVEYATTTGIVGVILLLGWWVTAAFQAGRGGQAELVVATLALLVHHLFEPQEFVLTPLMLLLAGAAAARIRLAIPGTVHVAQIVTGTVALALAGAMLVGDFTYRGADLDFNLDRAKRATTLLWPWARPVTLQTRIHLFRARAEKDPRELPLALAGAVKARAREPDDPAQWIAVAAIEAQLGRQADAATHYAGALQRNPWSTEALRERADGLDALGRRDQAAACRAAAQVQTRSGSALRRSRSECLRP